MLTPDSASTIISSFSLIALAEIGDKSQLVCMTLATRHKHWPVLLGATAAFMLLNALAVLFGAGVAAWIPEQVTAAIVAILFAVFGIQSLRSSAEQEDGEIVERPNHGVFLSTFLLLMIAEFGDKTQIAVAGLASNFPPLPVWIGASAALISLSALGIWLGCTLLQRLPIHWLHRISGGVFLIFAVIAAWKALGY